ncbi:MAG TPA: YdeI/OmpD-associated family protein [Acidobacteriota bacterium]|nr:YdeI/OmpD-associated family protein [Acidobacteriota bacterium]
MKRLHIKCRADWRKWLAENFARESEVWLIFYKNHTGKSSVPYEATVEEALCFGWIDSIIKRLDESRYLRKYTPRQPGSPWSESNKVRAENMIRMGRMKDAGLARINEAKSSGAWNQKSIKPRIPELEIPQEFINALATNAEASRCFNALASSYRRQYIFWIAMAKKAGTRERRIKEAVQKLDRGELLGLK